MRSSFYINQMCNASPYLLNKHDKLQLPLLLYVTSIFHFYSNTGIRKYNKWNDKYVCHVFRSIQNAICARKAVRNMWHLRCKDQWLKSIASQRPCQVDYNGSCHITAMKKSWRWSVLNWVMAWEHKVLLAYKADGCTKGQEQSRCKGWHSSCPYIQNQLHHWHIWRHNWNIWVKS